MKKEHDYASKIHAHLTLLFDEESEFYIDREEFKKESNLTHFVHALSNIAPNLLYQELTNDNKNLLDFNHLANNLCFQYLSHDKKEH